MKSVISLSCIMLFLFYGCCQEKSSHYIGAWKPVTWEKYSGDSIVWKMPGNLQGSEIKIFANEYFNWVGRYKLDTTFFNSFGGGTYTTEGNRLIQNVQYYGNQDRVGTSTRMLWDYQNDTCVQTWPYDENWELDEDTYYIKKWVKLK
jgi:hypothetical protein